MERRMCLWSWQMVHGEVGMSLYAQKSVNLPTRRPSSLWPERVTWDFRGGASSFTTDGWGAKGQERGQRSWSCRARTSSCLQTTEVRLPQDSIDVVIGETAAVAMETVLQGNSGVFRLWAGGGLGDAVVLAVYAWPGGNHYCCLWTTDPVTAVAAGRLQIQNTDRLWSVVSWMDAGALNKTFWAVSDSGALHVNAESRVSICMMTGCLLYP